MFNQTLLFQNRRGESVAYIPQNLREFQILNALGVFSIYEEEDFTGNGELTRAEAAAVAARMVGLVDGSLTEGKEMPYTGVSNCDEYLGYNVEFYYKKTAEDAMGTILWATPWQNEIIRIDTDDIVDYANKEYKFYVGKSEQKKKITGADIIYNGSSVKTLGFNKFKPEVGTVDLIDNDSDGTVDVVSITSYDVYFIKANNSTEFVLTSDDKKMIKDYDKVYWSVVGVDGEELPAVKVAKDMVLILAVSLDNKAVTGFQINEQIEGTYDSKYTEGGVQHAIINDTDYRVHPYCMLTLFQQ